MSDTPISPTQTDALAKLAEIPAVGSEELERPLAEQAKHHGRDWALWWQGSGERGDHIMEVTQSGLGYARELAWIGDLHHDQAGFLVAEHNEQVRRLREVIARQAVAKGLLQAELGRIKAVIPAPLTYEVPDAAEAIAATFREYVKVAAEATALRKAVLSTPLVDDTGGGGEKGGTCEPFGTGSREPGPTVPASGFDPSRLAISQPVALAECPVGLFLNDFGNLCLKTEYRNNEGRIDAYIVDSGEFFWGHNPQTIANQRKQIVRPLKMSAASYQPLHEDATPIWNDINVPVEVQIVANALRTACVDQFAAAWSFDVSWRFARAAIRAIKAHRSTSVSDRSGEAVETTGSTEGKSTADVSATPQATPTSPQDHPPSDPQMTVEARAALARLRAREGEDIDRWAEHLAADSVKIGEAEYHDLSSNPAAVLREPGKGGRS